MTTGQPTTLPREIVTERLPDGVRFRLPRRQLGRLRLIGIVPILFGSIFVAVPITMMAALFRDVLTRPSLFHLFVGVFLLVFVLVGLKPISIGMLMLFGRTTVELRRDWIRAIDNAGPFRNVRRARRSDVRKFEVNVSDDRQAPSVLEPLRRMGSLEAKFDGGKPMSVALGYDREWLVALGNELSRQISDGNVTVAGPALPPTVEVIKQLDENPDLPPSTEEIPVQPSSSKARIEETAGGATIVLPPMGLRRGSRGLFVFGLLWCAFIAVFTSVALFSSRHSIGSMLGLGLFLSIFWVVGLSMLAGSLNMARRRALLVATATELRIAHQGLFGKKAYAWPRDQLVAIRVDNSGMKVNNRNVIELQVHTMDGRKQGLLSGRDEAELHWIATVLRQRLGLPAFLSNE